MQNKVNSNKFSEETFPVTQETLKKLIEKIDCEIEDLEAEAEVKRNSEKSDYLQRELDNILIGIKRCRTIKELYSEKINLKEKISILEKNNIRLKEENHNLKVKIDFGIQKISDHMHNLPCEKEKELKIELSNSETKLRKEQEMRKNLENNIAHIVLNFNSLYQEVETARLIIVHKLKELQDKEKALAEVAKHQPEKRPANDVETSLKSRKSLSVAYTEEKGSKKDPPPS